MTSNPIEAEYLDGYVHNEEAWEDCSAFMPGRNTMFDIVNKLPEAEHGPMTRFSIYLANQRLDLNWQELPANAKPIRFKHFEIDQNIISGQLSIERIMKISFGYEYLDKSTGRNIQKIREIT